MAVSPERLMVEFLKADTPLATLTSGRIATKLPDSPTLPFIVVKLVAGGPEDGEAPLNLYNLQHDCLAGDQAAADTLFRALIDAALANINFTGTHGRLRGVGIFGVRRDDSENHINRFRYIVDVFAQMS